MTIPRRLIARVPGTARQRGLIGIVALMFIVIVTLFAMSQAASISASNLSDSARQSDSVEALFLAEAAIERAGYIYVKQATADCSDATTGVDGVAYTMGRGTYQILASFDTKFDGTTSLGTESLCRVRVQGKITSSGVTRTIETILSKEDDTISIESLNPNFNLPLWGCDTSPATCIPGTETRDQDYAHGPNQWSLTGGTQGWTYIGWDKQGGPDGSRAAFARKTKSGSGAATAGGAFTLATPIDISVPKTLRLTFDFRVWSKGSSNQEFQFSPRLAFDVSSTVYYPPDAVTAGGDCQQGGSTAGVCESDCTITNCHAGGGALEPSKSGGVAGGIGCGYIDKAGFESGPGTASYSDCSGYPAPSGNTGYKTGYLTYTIPGSGTRKLVGISFNNADGTGTIKGKEGNITWIWVDNLRLSVAGLAGGGPSKVWREVAAP